MTQTDVSRLLRGAADNADELRVRLQFMEETRVRVPVRVSVHAVDASGGGSPDADIMAIAFEVVLEATKSAQDDLKAIMARVKAMSAAKQALGELMNEIAKSGAARPPCPPVCALDLEAALLVLLTAYSLDLDREMEGLNHQLDSAREMNDLVSLELQMALDRRSKMLSTLSSIMKKMADTSSQIVQNLK